MKIAVLLSGQMRSAAFCLDSLRRHVLDRLGPHDLFAHVADDADTHLAERLSPRVLVAANPPALDEENLIHRSGHDFGGAPGDVARLLAQFWRLQESNALKTAAEATAGARYDWVLRVRPDSFYHTDIEDLATLDPTAVYVPTFGNYHGYNDRFAFGGSAAMDVYHHKLGTPLHAHLGAGGVLHPESILRGVLDRAGIPVHRTQIIFDTLRPDGTRLTLTWSPASGDVLPDFMPPWRHRPQAIE